MHIDISLSAHDTLNSDNPFAPQAGTLSNSAREPAEDGPWIPRVVALSMQTEPVDEVKQKRARNLLAMRKLVKNSYDTRA